MDKSTMMTLEDFLKMQEAMKGAQEDDTPYLAVADDELHVIGDPNETEVKTADYSVYFLFPDTRDFRYRSRMAGDIETDEINGEKLNDDVPNGFFLVRRDYNNVFVAPRRVGNVISAFAVVLQFYYDITDNGEVKDLSYEQMKEVLNVMNNEISDATYEVVASVLRIPDSEKDFMLPVNVYSNAVKIVLNNPDIVNASDLFFGLSPNSNR